MRFLFLPSARLTPPSSRASGASENSDASAVEALADFEKEFDDDEEFGEVPQPGAPGIFWRDDRERELHEGADGKDMAPRRCPPRAFRWR